MRSPSCCSSPFYAWLRVRQRHVPAVRKIGSRLLRLAMIGVRRPTPEEVSSGRLGPALLLLRPWDSASTSTAGALAPARCRSRVCRRGRPRWRATCCGSRRCSAPAWRPRRYSTTSAGSPWSSSSSLRRRTLAPAPHLSRPARAAPASCRWRAQRAGFQWRCVASRTAVLRGPPPAETPVLPFRHDDVHRAGGRIEHHFGFAAALELPHHVGDLLVERPLAHAVVGRVARDELLYQRPSVAGCRAVWGTSTAASSSSRMRQVGGARVARRASRPAGARCRR